MHILMNVYKRFLMVDTNKKIAGLQGVYIFNTFKMTVPMHIFISRKYLFLLIVTVIDIIQVRNFRKINM